jgi:hypothetical protein
MKRIYLVIAITLMAMHLQAQDYLTHVFFANQTNLPINLQPQISGNVASVEVRKLEFIPFEITHDHSLTISPGDFIGQREKDHNENNSSLALDRRRSFGNNNYNTRLEVRTGSDLLFTIIANGLDQSGPFVRILYNVEFTDGSTDVASPGRIIQDNGGTKAVVAKEIVYKGEAYKLVYGVYDENQDNTDNLIFSISKVVDTLYRYDPPLADTANPNLLHIFCYNPGILMPLEINDQDEIQRAEVMYKAIPKNMDVLIFQELFEPAQVNKILNDLKPWYPYHTGQHNRILINNIGQDGGVRIVSRYPILEEKEISFSENGCVPTDFFSLFANKGVKYAKINKHGQILHVFGTHTSLQPCDLYVMGKFIADMNLPENEVVIMGGDYNVDMNRIKNGSDDYPIMLDTLNALEPTYLTFLNDRSYSATTSGLSHMYCCNPEGRQHLDYVFVSGKHKMPRMLTNRSQQARLNEPDASFGIFDLGDHLPIYARIEFPAIQSDANTFSSCSGGSVTLKAQVVEPASGALFQWYRNGEAISGANADELTVSIQGAADFGQYECRYYYTYIPDTVVNNYFDPSYMDYQWKFKGVTESYLKLVYEIQPENPSDSCLGIVTSIFNPSRPVFILYPNPTDQVLQISGIDFSKVTSLEMVDMTGRQILFQNNLTSSGTVQLHVGDLTPGVYQLLLRTEKGVETRSFIKL